MATPMSGINTTKDVFIFSYQYHPIIILVRCIYVNLVDAVGLVGNHLVYNTVSFLLKQFVSFPYRIKCIVVSKSTCRALYLFIYVLHLL